MRNRYKYSIAIIVAILVAIIILYIKSNRWESYYINKLNEPAREFIVQALKTIPNPKSDEIALDLGAGVGHETRLLLEKNYNVIALDKEKIAFDFMFKRPEIAQYKDRLKTIVSSFEDLDFNLLPDLDMVIASFSMPFVNPKNFEDFWTHLVDKIKSNGYFIGNTFDPGFTTFNEKDRSVMSFHTKQQTIDLLKKFTILSFKEVKEASKSLGKYVHHYEIMAQKK
jgi:tellurite methyltransferase